MKRSLLPRLANPWAWIAVAGGLLAVGFVLQPRQALSGMLVAGVFGVQLTVGALFWIAMLTVSGATWWLPVRKHFLAVGEQLAVPAVMTGVTVVAGAGLLYGWAAPGAAEHSHLIHEKVAWLNRPFFSGRAVAIVAIWMAVSGAVGAALRRWIAGEDKARSKIASVSAAAIVVLAVTISVAFWDWTMSLEPEWFSTMYGVYGFCGALQGGIAIVTALAIHRSRRHGDAGVTSNTRHDFGKLVFAFSFFWGYIWFCQYMLIWYANLPEEVGHYITRTSPAWGSLFWLNVVLNFAVPFFALLPAAPKKHEGWLLQASLLVVVVRLLDVYLLVEPSLLAEPSLPIYPLAATVLMVALTLTLAHRRFASPQDAAPEKGVAA